MWSAATSTGPGTASLELTNTFKSGEGCDPAQTKTPCNGFPADVQATVVYTLTKDNQLKITYTAINSSSTQDTVINLTNHSYFNLGGEASGTVEHQLLQINADQYTPVDANLIPTGELKPVEGGLFDFRTARRVEDGIRDGRDPQIVFGRGYDHNWALDKGQTKTPELAARLEDPASGRVLEVLTTEPGVQFYAGNFLDGTLVGKQGHLYRMGDGIALEPQKFPDSPNKPNFPSARVDPGKPYRHVMVYRLSVKR